MIPVLVEAKRNIKDAMDNNTLDVFTNNDHNIIRLAYIGWAVGEVVCGAVENDVGGCLKEELIALENF